MSFTTEAIGGGVVVLRLTGDLDLAVVEDFERRLEEIEQGLPSVLALDLRSLEFIDSTGLRAVMKANERAGAQGRRLIVAPGHGQTRRVITTLGLDARLELVDDPLAGARGRA